MLWSNSFININPLDNDKRLILFLPPFLRNGGSEWLIHAQVHCYWGTQLRFTCRPVCLQSQYHKSSNRETARVLVFGGCPRVGGEGVLALSQVLRAYWGNCLLSTHLCRFPPAIPCLSVLRIWSPGHSVYFWSTAPSFPSRPAYCPSPAILLSITLWSSVPPSLRCLPHH